MKKFLISLVIMLGFGTYLYLNNGPNNTDTTPLPPPPTPDGGLNGGTSAPSETINPNAGGTNPPPPPPTTVGALHDGSYSGSVANSIFGDIQVQAIISGGKLTDVNLLKYPNDREHSIEVNQGALPTWKTEAIQAQSANIDIVSGATQSTEAFRESLAVALKKAAS